MRLYDYAEFKMHRPILEKGPRGDCSELDNKSIRILKINQLYSVSQKIHLFPRNMKKY